MSAAGEAVVRRFYDEMKNGRKLELAADLFTADHTMHEISQDLEGIGPVRSYFVDVEDLAGTLPPVPDSSWLRRFGGTVGIVGRGSYLS